mmetsp:Transcript_52501/g.154955  ORF Transcript_52501/g.154955 Transcript_52501/m.154955 type:complete len:204 (-) Transcript_52501:2709-3320(-)
MPLRSRHKAADITGAHRNIHACWIRWGRGHCPEHTLRCSQLSLLDREGQSHLVPALCPHDDAAQLQRAIQIGRVHLRALQRPPRSQAPNRHVATAPRLVQRAVARTVLQSEPMIPRVECRQPSSASTMPGACLAVIGLRHLGVRSNRTRAVDGQPEQQPARPVRLPAAHLEAAAVGHRALNLQPNRLQRKRPHKQHAAQRSCW